jgi:hypothetical protein
VRVMMMAVMGVRLHAKRVQREYWQVNRFRTEVERFFRCDLSEFHVSPTPRCFR